MLSSTTSTPAAVGRRPDLRGPVVAVGEGVVGADGAAVLQLVLAARGGQHRRPERLRVLDRERPDPAGAAVHEERPPRRRGARTRGSTSTVAATSTTPAASTSPYPGRWRDHLARRGRRPARRSRRRPAGRRRLAHRPALDALPERRDVPRHLEPDQRARPGRGRVVPLALQEVGPVDPGGDHVDQQLARTGLRSSTSLTSSTSGPPGSRATIAFIRRACHARSATLRWSRGRALDGHSGGVA